MSSLAIGLAGIVLLVIIMLLGTPIGIAMGLVGFCGFAYVAGADAALGVLKTVPYSTAASYALSVIPLFVLMGQFAFYSGLSKELYDAAYKWLGRFPGGMAMATIAGCAGFAAICGSSPATAATMGTVALPEMKKYKYHPGLATGSIAAGGTLGILIPPSVGFILYGVITQQSIGKLFLAGIIPGIVLAALFILTIWLVVLKRPDLGPPGPRVSFREKLMATGRTWGILLLFFVVIGGMLLGVFSPTEAAAVGAFGAMFMAFAKGLMKWRVLVDCLLDTGRVTAMIFLILIGAMIFGYFLAVTKLPMQLADFLTGLDMPRYVILTGIILIYMFLGCIMDSLAMVLLTVPIFYPVVTGLGFDPIWFGVIMVIIMEQGLITPPVGLNVFVIGGIARDTELYTIFRGIFPFWITMLIMIVILVIFPQIALFLPNLAK